MVVTSCALFTNLQLHLRPFACIDILTELAAQNQHFFTDMAV